MTHSISKKNQKSFVGREGFGGGGGEFVLQKGEPSTKEELSWF